MSNISLPVFYVFWNVTKGVQKLAIAVDGAVVKYLNAPQNTDQLTSLLSWAPSPSLKKKKSMALNDPGSRQISINSPVIQLCLFIKLILLSNSSLSDAFTLTQLLTEQGKHSFVGTHPALMAGTVRHQRHIHKLLCNTDTLQLFLFYFKFHNSCNSRIPVLSRATVPEIAGDFKNIRLFHVANKYSQSFLQPLM